MSPRSQHVVTYWRGHHPFDQAVHAANIEVDEQGTVELHALVGEITMTPDDDAWEGLTAPFSDRPG